MLYAELTFIGQPAAHCAAWEENRRLTRKRDEARRAFDRRK